MTRCLADPGGHKTARVLAAWATNAGAHNTQRIIPRPSYNWKPAPLGAVRGLALAHRFANDGFVLNSWPIHDATHPRFQFHVVTRPGQGRRGACVRNRAPWTPLLNQVLDLVSADMSAMETRLSEAMKSPVGPIPEIGVHILQAGGKRLRPLLAILAARASGTPLDIGMAVGAAGELIHTATLLHDDVVDDGRVRRGRPAARTVFGNGIVVLAGDFAWHAL